MSKFDNIVGIGYNCEISFRIRNYFGKIDSQLFSWAYVYDREKFLDAFEYPEKIYSGDMILKDNGMFECGVTKLSFHPRHEILEDGSRDEEERIQWCKDELKQRVEHLKKKHKTLLSGDRNTLFLLKVKPDTEEQDIEFIKNVYELIHNMYHSGRFMLVVLFPEKRVTEAIRELETEKLKVRTLRWFPPQKHTDIASDSRRWAQIFYEFCGGNKKEFFRRERKQRYKIIPGMIKYKLVRILKR